MLDTKLIQHLAERPARLQEAKRVGKKIVGYLPGNYVPEELIYAAGAIPVGFIGGGDGASLQASLATLPRVFCPFSRAQIGEMTTKRNPYYGMPDMIIAPVTCQHLKKVAEIWEYKGDVEVFKLGIPHQYNNDFEFDYFLDRLNSLKTRLESLTGQKITGERLRDSIRLYNKMRDYMLQISLLRRAGSPPLNTGDFIRLNHASFLADPVFMVETLETMYGDLKIKKSESDGGKPRIMLIGPNIAEGDYGALNLIEEAGSTIAIEEIFEGIRNYWTTVKETGDPLRSLAGAYLIDRLPPAFMRYSTRRRLDNALKLISDFNIQGVVWYELLCCETYDAESYYFAEKLREQNIPMLVLEMEYGSFNTGQIKTRIEAFLEMIRGGME